MAGTFPYGLNNWFSCFTKYFSTRYMFCDPVKPILNITSPKSFSFISSMPTRSRSEEHTSELQSRGLLVCRLLLEKKKDKMRDRSCVIGLDERSPTGTADRGDPYEKDMRGDRNAPYRGRAGLMQQPEDGTVAEDNP